MSNRITAIAASALAFAFGCEQPIDRVGQEEPTQQEQIAPEEQQQQGFNQGPDDEQRQQAERQRQQQQHQQQMAQAGQGQGQHSPGQVVKQQSESNMNRTISRLNRELRQADMDVVATVRYDERMRQRAMREGGEQAQQGGQAGGEIGDVRMLLFRDTQQEARAIESEGPETLLKAPRALLVYERGEDVIVSYQMPEAMAATGAEEPTTERLQRIVQESTQSQRGQQQAQREEQQQEQQASRQEQQAQREQGQEQQAQRGEQQQGQEQQAQREQEQQAQREQQEQQRQARAGQQREQGQAMN